MCGSLPLSLCLSGCVGVGGSVGVGVGGVREGEYGFYGKLQLRNLLT